MLRFEPSCGELRTIYGEPRTIYGEPRTIYGEPRTIMEDEYIMQAQLVTRSLTKN